MRAKVEWIDKVSFKATSETGHTVTIDGPPDLGGENRGVRPMEMVLMGVGGCTAFDVIRILQKARQNVTDCVTELTSRRAETIPNVFEAIHIHFVVTGDSLYEKKVERAVELTARRYCSASIMLERGGVNITHSFEVVQAD
jgi:putative redox protein